MSALEQALGRPTIEVVAKARRRLFTGDFYLYVMLDVFSRYVVGWMVAHRESAALAERFLQETCARQGIGRDQLTIHAGRGRP